MRCHFMVILLLCVSSSLSKEICTVGDVDIDWYIHVNKFKLNSTDRGIVVEEFEIENVKNSYFEDSKYLEVKIDGNKMEIKLTDEFKNYEKTESELSIRVKWYIECEADGKNETFDLDYQQYILGENKYDPEFLQDEYLYVFYGDLKRDFSLSDAVHIQARDWDISADYLSFEIPTEDLSISSDYLRNKTVSAELKTARYIKAPFEEKFTMKVNDRSLGETRSASVPLTLILKPLDETMEFESAEYEAQLIGDQQLEFKNEIRLKNGLDFDTEVKIRSDYVDYFAVSIDKLRFTINVKLVKPLPLLVSRKYNKLEVSLDAHWRGLNATTKIVINSEDEVAKLCYIYGLNLDATENKGETIPDDHKGVIATYDTLNVESVDCSGTGTKYISCVHDKTKLVLSVTDEFKNYEENEYSQEIYLNMSIKCPYDVKKTEYLQYVKDINNHDPRFDREKYSFVLYNTLPMNLDLTSIMPITVSDKDVDTYYFDVDVAHDEGEYYNHYIQMSVGRINQKQASCEVKVRQDIPPGFETDFVITVRDDAFSPSSRSSQAIISIKVIKDQDQLKFKKTEVNAVMKDNVIDSIEMENGFDYDTKFNIRSLYQDYFKIVPNVLQNKIEIQAIKDVSAIRDDVVEIIVEAEWHGVTDSVKVYLFMDGELPPTVASSTESTSTEAEHIPLVPLEHGHHFGLEAFKTWTTALNIIQIVAVSVVGITLCGMAYVAIRYYY